MAFAAGMTDNRRILVVARCPLQKSVFLRPDTERDVILHRRWRVPMTCDRENKRGDALHRLQRHSIDDNPHERHEANGQDNSRASFISLT
jgi:hypothetical protein